MTGPKDAAAGMAARQPDRVPSKDPQPSVDRIDDLARQILKGDILLPKFQREFVWSKPQVLEILDSIARNYPIGSVLLWQSRQELKSENKIADLEIELPRPDYPVNYLLDGQQRLSSLCGALYWHGRDPRSRWNIAYDLRKQSFFHLESLDDPPPHQVRMNRLADPAAYFRQLSVIESDDKEELKRRGEELFNRFKDYKIAVVTLGDMSIEDVAPIFERINSTGTPLTTVDLIRAATWTQDFDLVDEIEKILDGLSDKGFDGFDRKSLLRNISAAAGGDFSSGSIDGLRDHTGDQLRTATQDAGEAYKRAVDFLSTEIGVPSEAALPYANQLVVLAEMFRRLPHPNGDQSAAARNWFWRTGVTGYFRGWNTGMMAADLKAVADVAEGRRGDIPVPTIPIHHDLWVTQLFRMNNAQVKLFGLALATESPRDLLTGMRINTTSSLSWSNKKEFHHLFPRAFLKGRVNGADPNCLANIIYLSSESNKVIGGRAPSTYLKDAQVRLGNDYAAVLRSNLVSDEAYQAALRDDFETFVDLRARTIASKVANFAGW